MSEYGWTLDQTLETKIRQALCLYAAIALRHGFVWAGPSYVMRDL